MRILHVGCGGESLPAYFGQFEEVRLDIDPSVKPDIVGDMKDLPLEDGTFDAIYCAHALEHLMPHDVVPCLEGFRRVLRKGGAVLIYVPDLQDVRPTEDVLYEAPCGPITGLDMMYGFRPFLKEHPYMAHRTGFVSDTLKEALVKAGFSNIATARLPDYNLRGAGSNG